MHRLVLPAVLALALLVPGTASAATGAISGTITDASTGDGLPDACVETFDSGGSGLEVITDSSGQYTISGLATGNYKLTFFPCFGGNYVQQFYNGKATFNTADQVAVTDGQTTTGINAALAHGGTLTGTVTNENGDPVQGIFVNAYNAVSGGSANTDANGEYTITGLGPGSFTVRFLDTSSNTYITQYYNNKTDESAADPVPVTVDHTTPDIDATLHRGGSISGTVTEEGTGTPLAQICVAVYGPGVNGLTVRTDASGDYTFGKLQSGSYGVAFFDCNTGVHETEYYDNKPDPNSANSVGVTAGSDTPDIDAALTVDTTAPTTQFTSGPVGSTTATSASIGFIADESFVTYECQLDGGGWGACTSPQSYSGLSVGVHTFQVRATDPAGNVENPPAGGSWTIVAQSSTTTDAVPPGGTLSTDNGAGPTPGEPLSTAVTSPSGGQITITDTFATTQTPASGFAVFGREVQITAPDATVADPLRLVFAIDASVLPSGVNPSTLTVLRNGLPAGECSGSATASPDPCVTNRQTLTGGDLQITVLTSHASYWNLAKPAPLSIVPPPAGTSSPPAVTAPPKAKKKKCKKVKKRSAAAAKKKCKKK